MKRRLNWGTGVAVVYTLFACSTIGFVVFAVSQPVDLVSADYYQRALEQDARMAAVANARALGAALRVVVDGAAREIAITIPEPRGVRQGAITLYRPADAAADRHLTLDARGATQRVSLDGVPSGRWILQIEWTSDGLPYYHEEPVLVP